MSLIRSLSMMVLRRMRNVLKKLFLLALASASVQAQSTPYPVASNRAVVALKALTDPGKAPTGANDWHCHSDSHPYPVVLIPGTFNNMQVAFGALSPLLANAGYCVFALNYGGKSSGAYVQSTGALADSHQQIAAFVRQVLQSTGADKVTLVGHSQGGLHAIQIAHANEFSGKIAAVIGLAPSTHGTDVLDKFESIQQPTLAGAVMKKICLACEQQRSDSSAVFSNNAQLVAPGVQYHILATRDDRWILPPSRSFIESAQANNLYLQDICPDHHVSHRGLLYDKATQQWVLSVLSGAANQPSCRT